MAIKFKEVDYIYDQGMPYAFKALDNINLEIEEGKITAIIGETGSGKSTLVEHLNALLIPFSGSLEINDYVIEANKKNKKLKELRRNVGLVFQFSEYQLFEETVIKDVAFGPLNFHDDEQTAYAKAKEALKLVHIDESLFNKNPLELSGGQKRRVAIAGIIAMNPSVLVLDEPTAGLDPVGSDEMIDLFMSLNKKLNKTIIIVSHNNEIVYKFADNTVLLNKGKIIYSGNTIDLFNNDSIINQYSIKLPKVIEFKNKLIAKGFNLNDNYRDLESLVNKVSGEVKK